MCQICGHHSESNRRFSRTASLREHSTTSTQPKRITASPSHHLGSSGKFYQDDQFGSSYHMKGDGHKSSNEGSNSLRVHNFNHHNHNGSRIFSWKFEPSDTSTDSSTNLQNKKNSNDINNEEYASSNV